MTSIMYNIINSKEWEEMMNKNRNTKMKSKSNLKKKKKKGEKEKEEEEKLFTASLRRPNETPRIQKPSPLE